MDLTLTRLQCRSDGVFSDLKTSANELVAQCLEHAYTAQGLVDCFVPKIPPGVFKCVRSEHRLHGMTENFETFEVMDVPGHSNILFHWGNYNKDSDGCILLGKSIERAPDQTQMITDSRDAFARFMRLQDGQLEFTLTVE